MCGNVQERRFREGERKRAPGAPGRLRRSRCPSDLRGSLSRAAGLALFLLLVLRPAGGRGQETGGGGAVLSPDSVAHEFQNALRALAWRAALQRLHPEALEAFHGRISIMVETDTTGGPVDNLYPQGGRELFRSRSPGEIFLRVLQVIQDEAPGLIHALVVRDVDMVGSVLEPPDLAHVVYRSLADLSGARPELRLMTMKRQGNVWRVLDSQELDVLVEAFRGISRTVRPPGIRSPPPDTSASGGNVPGTWRPSG